MTRAADGRGIADGVYTVGALRSEDLLDFRATADGV